MSRRSRSAALAATMLAWAAAARASDPALDYMLNCQGCHLADGKGTPGSVPALAGSVGTFLGVQGGREYLVRVPGVAQSALDDDALARVLNWVLGRFDPDDLPAGFVPYTAGEVAPLRRRPLTDVEGARAALVPAPGRAR